MCDHRFWSHCTRPHATSQLLELDILVTAGFFTPIGGIPFASTDYQVEMLSRSSPVVWVPLDFITIIPVISGEIHFYSCEPQSVYEVSGDNTTVFLEAGNSLNIADDGSLILIQSSIYEIQFIVNGTVRYPSLYDLIPITPPYSGTIVLNGQPHTELYTPPLRPAYYFSGNYSTRIRFAYQVRRGDSGLGIILADPLKSNYIASNPDLNGGHLYRYSMNPSLEANSVISSNMALLDSTLVVDTSTPYVTGLTTTSPAGTYAADDVVDFEVTFNVPVSVRNGTYGGPSLYLHINPYSYVIASYYGGSGSNTLIFKYVVVTQMYSAQLSAAIISTSFPITQPLRSISNNYFGYIRRASAAPLIDANLSLPAQYVASPLFGVSIIGIAPHVESLTSNNVSARGDNLTAGDLIYISIKYSQPINISSNGSEPYILLDLGKPSPGNASYIGQSENDTLVFSYQIQTDDVAQNGLYLFCTCIDYFNRSFVALQRSRIYAIWNSSIDASVVIAQNSSAQARLINPYFTIDNASPAVLRIGTNVTDALYSPGTSILITLQFTHRLQVFGFVTLAIRGDNTACSARYYSGNGSDTLSFLYLTNEASGTCRLDVQNATSLDTSRGEILRFSNYPQIPVNALLPLPGVQTSLGVVTNIIIDPSPSIIIATVASVSTVLPMTSVAISTSTLYNTFVAYEFAQENSSQYFNGSTSIPALRLLLANSFVEPVSAVRIDSNSITFYDPYSYPFEFLPLFVEGAVSPNVANVQNLWWSAYSSQSSFDILVNFDRKVDASGSWITIGSDIVLNKAPLNYYSALYNLTLSKEVGFDLKTYQLEYNGYLTRCISSHASAQGIQSIESALTEIPAIRDLGVIVRLLQDSITLMIYEISFLRPPTGMLRSLSDSGGCQNPLSTQSIDLSSGKQLNFRYPIRDIDAIVLIPNQNIQAGIYELVVNPMNGLKLSAMGIEPNSVRFEQHSLDLGATSTRRNIVNRGVSRVIRSILVFETSVPNTTSSLDLSICLGSRIYAGDTFSIYLPGFNGYSFSLAYSNISVLWIPSNASLTLNVTVGGNFCVNVAVSESLGLITPTFGVYENSADYNFTYASADRGVYQSPFSSVSAVGLSYSVITLGTPTYKASTEMNITFILATALLSQGASIIVTLPGFTSPGLTDAILKVTGDFEYIFGAFWNQNAEEVQISTRLSLLPGVYSLILASYLRVSSEGVSPSDPPLIRIESPSWNMTSTPIASFPIPVGVEVSALVVDVLRPSQVVSKINLFVNFTRVLRGPGNFSLYLPNVWSSNGSSIMNFSVSVQQLWVWRNDEKVLTTYLNDTWSDQIIALNSNFIGLTVLDSNNVTLMDSMIEFYGADGFLSMVPIGSIRPIISVLSSSISFASVLFSTNSSIQVTAALNNLAYPGLNAF